MIALIFVFVKWRNKVRKQKKKESRATLQSDSSDDDPFGVLSGVPIVNNFEVYALNRFTTKRLTETRRRNMSETKLPKKMSNMYEVT